MQLVGTKRPPSLHHRLLDLDAFCTLPGAASVHTVLEDSCLHIKARASLTLSLQVYGGHSEDMAAAIFQLAMFSMTYKQLLWQTQIDAHLLILAQQFQLSLELNDLLYDVPLA